MFVSALQVLNKLLFFCVIFLSFIYNNLRFELQSDSNLMPFDLTRSRLCEPRFFFGKLKNERSLKSRVAHFIYVDNYLSNTCFNFLL